MAWTAPRSWVADEVVTADLMNTHVRDNLKAIGDAWTSWTPTLSQGVSTNIAKTVTYAKYVAAGKLIIATVKLAPTAAGTAGSAITITLPVTAATSAFFMGSGAYQDASPATNYPALVYLNSATTLALFRSDVSWSNAVGADPNIAVASGDTLHAWFAYEGA